MAACVCVSVCIPECIPVCIAVCEGETVRSFSFVPHLMFPSQAKRPGTQMTGTQVWFDRAHLQAVHAVRGP